MPWDWFFGRRRASMLLVPPGDADGLHPVFADRLARLCDAVPGLYVLSGRRSSEQQETLYQRFLAGTGNPANPPGVSNHEFGVAADLAGANLYQAKGLAAGLGLCFPIRSEEWHCQPAELTATAWPGSMPEIR